MNITYQDGRMEQLRNLAKEEVLENTARALNDGVTHIETWTEGNRKQRRASKKRYLSPDEKRQRERGNKQ